MYIQLKNENKPWQGSLSQATDVILNSMSRANLSASCNALAPWQNKTQKTKKQIEIIFIWLSLAETDQDWVNIGNRPNSKIRSLARVSFASKLFVSNSHLFMSKSTLHMLTWQLLEFGDGEATKWLKFCLEYFFFWIFLFFSKQNNCISQKFYSIFCSNSISKWDW